MRSLPVIPVIQQRPQRCTPWAGWPACSCPPAGAPPPTPKRRAAKIDELKSYPRRDTKDHEEALNSRGCCRRLRGSGDGAANIHGPPTRLGGWRPGSFDLANIHGLTPTAKCGRRIRGLLEPRAGARGIVLMSIVAAVRVGCPRKRYPIGLPYRAAHPRRRRFSRTPRNVLPLQNPAAAYTVNQ